MSAGGRRKSLLNFFSRSSTYDEPDTSGGKAPPIVRSHSSGPQGSGVEGAEVFEMFENERYRDQIGWSSKNLELDDPKNFTWAYGEADQFVTPPPPEGYDFLGIWELDKLGADEGWLYARSFVQLNSDTDVSKGSSKPNHRARRRRWVRDMKRRDDIPLESAQAYSDDETEETGSLEPDRVAEKYLFLKLGSSGIASSPSKSTTTGLGEEDDAQSSLTGAEGGTAKSLKWLGKQIRELELECEREADAATREWKKSQYPQYKATANEIEKSITGLQQKIKNESDISEEHVISLEETLKAHMDALNATKKRMYFPNSNLSSGSADAYFAIDDFWIEDISGVFVVDMIGSLISPQVIVNLTGVSEGASSGVSLKLKLEGFKLRAKGAPSINVDETLLTACVKVSMMLTFISSTSKWQLLPADFRLDLLSFSGPYGLSRAFVSTILAMVSSKIREAILLALPMEIGHLLMTLPIPFGVRGEFSLQGTPLCHLSSPLSEANDLSRSLGFNHLHMAVFMDLQKMLGRGKVGHVLKTMQDMINYRTLGAKHSRLWEKMVRLWNQASALYVEMKVEEVAAVAFASPVIPSRGDKGLGINPLGKYDATAVATLATFSFDDIIQAVEDVMRKPLSVEFKLHHISGQVSVNQVIDKLRKLAHRLALVGATAGKDKKKKSAGDDILLDKRVSALLKRATRQFDEAKQILSILARNFDYGQVLADIALQSGAAGSITVRASQILGKAPISIWLNLPQRLIYLGIFCPVPYVLAVKTDPEGNLVLELNHCGSDKSTRRGVFMQHENRKDIAQRKVRVKSNRKSVNWRAQWASKLSKLKVQQLEEESKNHLSPLISISDSYKLPAGLDFRQSQSSLEASGGDHLGGMIHSSFHKLSSKIKKAVPEKLRKKDSGEDFDVDLAVSGVQISKSSNIFKMQTSHSHLAPSQPFSDIPPTAEDYDEDYDEDGEDVFDEDDGDLDSETGGGGERGGDDISLAQSVSISMSDGAAEPYFPPKPKTHIPILRSYRRKARLEQTINAVPKEDDVVEIGSAVIYKPKVTIVTEKAVSLRAGAELLSFSLGKTSAAGVEDSHVYIEQVVRPSFRKRGASDANQGFTGLTEDALKSHKGKPQGRNSDESDVVSVSSASGEVVSDSEMFGDGGDQKAIQGGAAIVAGNVGCEEEFKNSGVDVPEDHRNVIGEADGSPVVVQTGSGIKVLVEVPRVDVRIGIADFLRFINRLMSSPELKAWLGASDESNESDFDELIAFIKAVIARAGKYFLLPGLVCELCIVGKLVIVNNEVVVKVETPSKNNASGTSYADISEGQGKIGTPSKVTRTTSNNIFLVGGSHLGSAATQAASEADTAATNTTKRVSMLADALPHEDEEEDFWANHKAGESDAKPTPSKSSVHEKEHGPPPVRAAYVKISMNMMDVIEDHKVLTSLGQDLILALLSRALSRDRLSSKRKGKPSPKT